MCWCVESRKEVMTANLPPTNGIVALRCTEQHIAGVPAGHYYQAIYRDSLQWGSVTVHRCSCTFLAVYIRVALALAVRSCAVLVGQARITLRFWPRRWSGSACWNGEGNTLASAGSDAIIVGCAVCDKSCFCHHVQCSSHGCWSPAQRYELGSTLDPFSRHPKTVTAAPTVERFDPATQQERGVFAP